MEIYLIRHTSPDVAKGVCYGQSDIPLKSSFLEEAEKVLAAIPNSFDMVYSSPLQRCYRLAALINIDYITDNRLMELNFGAWELKKWNEIPNDEIEPWYTDWVNTPTKEGESYQALQNRVIEFLKEIPLNYKRIAIVAHAGTIRSLLSHFKNVELSSSFKRFKIKYGGVKIVQMN